MQKTSTITVHGRFQPPLHKNHWAYIKHAFELADHVQILITNPYQNEAVVSENPERNSLERNPFTYEERMDMFTAFFENMNIDRSRYSFKPFLITDLNEWKKVLDPNVPNLVNVYGPWSEKKYATFKELGYRVIRTDNPRLDEVSGTHIREILKQNLSRIEMEQALLAAGFMPEALEGLFKILSTKS